MLANISRAALLLTIWLLATPSHAVYARQLKMAVCCLSGFVAHDKYTFDKRLRRQAKWYESRSQPASDECRLIVEDAQRRLGIARHNYAPVRNYQMSGDTQAFYLDGTIFLDEKQWRTWNMGEKRLISLHEAAHYKNDDDSFVQTRLNQLKHFMQLQGPFSIVCEHEADRLALEAAGCKSCIEEFSDSKGQSVSKHGYFSRQECLDYAAQVTTFCPEHQIAESETE